jgi:RNA polymerase I-specific transcription initiation factor RRN7
MLNKDFGMALPPLNVSLILYRWIRALFLPLEIFAASQRLIKLLDLDLSTFIASKGNKNVALRYQEVQLMALIIVATKILFPFDKIERRPYQPTDLSSLFLDWDAWSKLQAREANDPGTAKPLPFHEGFDFDESDCLSAADQRLDAYLDWYQDNIAREEIREHGRVKQDAEFRRTLFQMFPMPVHHPKDDRGTPIIESENTSGRLGESHERFYSERREHPTESRSVNRVGSLYRRYRTVEELSGPAKLLFEKSAALAGLSLENMVLAVFWTEKKLQKFEEGLRKNAKTFGAG